MKIVARPIDVIATFQKGAYPVPFKFRLEEEDGRRHDLKVDKVIETEKRKLAGIESVIYTCQSVSDGRKSLGTTSLTSIARTPGS